MVIVGWRCSYCGEFHPSFAETVIHEMKCPAGDHTASDTATAVFGPDDPA